MVTELTTTQPTEDEQVMGWREEQFRDLGYSHPYAMALSHVDLNEARRLDALGCTPELAERILL